MATLFSSPAGVALGGFLIGCAFGALVYRTNFCIMGALSDIVNLGDRRRLSAWLLGIATAIVLVEILRRGGAVPVGRSMYLSPRLNWLGHIVGGLIFGFGMVLSGGCPTRNLVRFGAGDLRALVVLIVIGIAGFMTMGGLIAPLPGFGVASVLGTLAGAAGMARAMGRFRVLGFADVVDMKRNLAGAALMGIGGAMALGCTIGQGVTGLSTLAMGSMLTTGALVAGGFQGLKYLERVSGD